MSTGDNLCSPCRDGLLHLAGRGLAATAEELPVSVGPCCSCGDAGPLYSYKLERPPIRAQIYRAHSGLWSWKISHASQLLAAGDGFESLEAARDNCAEQLPGLNCSPQIEVSDNDKA